MSTNIGLQIFPSGVTHLENKKYKEKSLKETTLENVTFSKFSMNPSSKLIQDLSFLFVTHRRCGVPKRFYLF